MILEIIREDEIPHLLETGAPTPANVILALTAKDGDEIIAFGIIKLFAEAIIIPKKEGYSLAKATKLLMEKGAEICRTAKLEELHAFVKDPSYAEILEKHLNFSEAVGKALVLKVSSGEEQQQSSGIES